MQQFSYEWIFNAVHLCCELFCLICCFFFFWIFVVALFIIFCRLAKYYNNFVCRQYKQTSDLFLFIYWIIAGFWASILLFNQVHCRPATVATELADFAYWKRKHELRRANSCLMWWHNNCLQTRRFDWKLIPTIFVCVLILTNRILKWNKWENASVPVGNIISK